MKLLSVPEDRAVKMHVNLPQIIPNKSALHAGNRISLPEEGLV